MRRLNLAKVRELESLKASNQRAEYVRNEIAKIDNYLDIAGPYKDALNKIRVLTEDKYGAFQKNRVAFVENSLAENIELLFPKFNFIPKISYSFERNCMKSELLLQDARGNFRYPRLTEGKFMQQLIGFTSAINVLELLGADTFYIDEAFSNASMNNKEKMSDVLESYHRRGIQMILISQSPECYSALSRREFHLENNGDFCVVTKVEDFVRGEEV